MACGAERLKAKMAKDEKFEVKRVREAVSCLCVHLQQQTPCAIERYIDDLLTKKQMSNIAHSHCPGLITDCSCAFNYLQFILFEHKEGSRLLDPRDVHTVVRSLGVNPTAAQLGVVLDQLLVLTAESDSSLISMEHFETVVAAFLVQQEAVLYREDYSTLIRAFRAFDQEGKGWIEVETLRSVMGMKGEVMGEDELSRMVSFAGDGQGRVYYEDYAQKLAQNGRAI